MPRLLVSTGEVSGDLQGGLLVEALHAEARRRQLPLEVVALGGPRMQAAGARLLANTAGLGAIGLLEALPLLLPTLTTQARVNRWLNEQMPDGVVLIDYMGANVKLGLKIKSLPQKVPIFYYIAPQEWAYQLGDGGSTRLIGFSDRILAIFPQEASFYAARGAEVTWVGHPLLDTLQPLPSRQQARSALGLPSAAPVLLLLPASRRQELRYLLPTMAAGLALVQRRLPALEVLVPAAQPGFEPVLERALRQAGLRGRVIPAERSDSLKPQLWAAADAALTKSGTVNLELALRGVPQVAAYRLSRPTAFLARQLLRFNVEHISPVNLVLEERLVTELLQQQLQPDAVAAAVEPLLRPNSEERQRILAGYGRLRQRLGEPGATQRAAAAILDSLPPC
ncbi:MAG: lipid-A-disaccharide synthase [Cyanobium sp.]|jgi:lipid-A-disaccharide synthase|nr:lipid-A-disaccharide synthase [Synechococcaceae cyanobacterium]